ncbi:MAG: hypothetical protein INR68_07235 [Methylobacterium mesophilicum]|nr:hypothetical protein [Methylobacterium mesophilicum]
MDMLDEGSLRARSGRRAGSLQSEYGLSARKLKFFIGVDLRENGCGDPAAGLPPFRITKLDADVERFTRFLAIRMKDLDRALPFEATRRGLLRLDEAKTGRRPPDR